MLNCIKSVVKFVTCRKARRVPEEMVVPYAVAVEGKVIHYVEAKPMSPSLAQLPIAVEYPVNIYNRTHFQEAPRMPEPVVCQRTAALERAERQRIRLSQMTPLEQLKDAIMASRKKQAFDIIDAVSTPELQEALIYLSDINRTTPKNKTRPIIRRVIINALNDRNI